VIEEQYTKKQYTVGKEIKGNVSCDLTKCQIKIDSFKNSGNNKIEIKGSDSKNKAIEILNINVNVISKKPTKQSSSGAEKR
jgi:hypothetical protein